MLDNIYLLSTIMQSLKIMFIKSFHGFEEMILVEYTIQRSKNKILCRYNLQCV